MLKNADKLKFEGKLRRGVGKKYSDFQGEHDAMPVYNDNYKSSVISKDVIRGESSSNLQWLYGLRCYSQPKNDNILIVHP